MGTHKLFNGISRGVNKVNYYCLLKPKEPCQNCVYSSKEEVEGWRWKTQEVRMGLDCTSIQELGERKIREKLLSSDLAINKDKK